MTRDATKSVASGELRQVSRWRVEVRSGPSKGLALNVAEATLRVGSAIANDLVLADDKVSRRHLEIQLGPAGLRVTDIGSKNGTFYQGSRIGVADLPLAGAVLQLGASEIAILPDSEPVAWVKVARDRCGRLLGQSECMRDLFAQIERLAPAAATVLIHGETGTGKELVAEAIHELSPRHAAAFEVIDCAAIPRDLIESELFGHVRGAFTGAASDHRGAFERASGGTVLLDEIGELDVGLQPKLLRVLETGTVRPVGSERTLNVDVRVVAASLRDLGQEVRDKRFREDLYYRLSVAHIVVPPLRARMEDLPLLVDHLLGELGAPPLNPAGLKVLASYHWPGNVRQLRNVLERASALAGGGPLTIRPGDLEFPSAQISPSALLAMPYKDAKEQLVDRFTREYLQALLVRNGGNVSAAAREAQIDRTWIIALARRHGIRVRD